MTSPITIYDQSGTERLRGTQRPGSQPGAVIARRSVVFAFGDIGYDAGGGFALFDTGLTLAINEEVLSWYVHNPIEWKSLTGVGTDFTWSAYLGAAGGGDGLSAQQGAGTGVPDTIGSQSATAPAQGITAAVSPGVTITADTPVFGYLSGLNEALTQGEVVFVVVVATAV